MMKPYFVGDMHKLRSQQGFTALEITVVILLFAILGLGYYVVHASKKPAPSPDVHFTGTITKNCNGGTGGCSMGVDDNTLYVKPDGIPKDPWGTVYPGVVIALPGTKVEVYAHHINYNYYTLEGSKSYYIKIAQ